MKSFEDRSAIEPQYKWDLTSLFDGDEGWEGEFSDVRKVVQADPFADVRGQLHRGSPIVLDCIQRFEIFQERLTKLWLYAHLKSDEDTRVATYQGMLSRIQMIHAEYAEKASFFDPEVLALPEEQLGAMLQEPGLSGYKHLLDNLIRNKPHVLSNEGEALLASLGDVFGASGGVYGQLTNADFDHGSFAVDGTEFKVTEGRLSLLFDNPDRRVRQQAYEHVYDTYWKHKNAIAALYSANVKKDVALARAKRFQTAREAALFTHNIPTAVYDALIEGVHANVGHVRRYLQLRQKRLGLDKVRLYDKYIPLVEMKQVEYSFEEGFELVREGLAALGPEYGEILDKAKNERWIDVFETPGKRSGAYSSGFYASYPYLLLNYQGTYDSVSTLAHELGHSIHTYLSGKTQPPAYADYPIFLAEIASTVNETLLVNHLLDTSDDDQMRASLINQQLDSLVGTVYRQAMFAEFEWKTHELVEQGQALTHDSLCDMYAKINALYHGEAYEDDERAPAEWSRIPHFYHAFYVYQYATGMSAALVFAERIRKEGRSALEKYLGFLKSGSKDYPLAILKEAGVDMTDPEIITQALQIFGTRVEELETLLG